LKATVTRREQAEADWDLLKTTAKQQRQGLIGVSTVVGLNRLPCGHTLLTQPALDPSAQTLGKMRGMGFAACAARERNPYRQAALKNFSKEGT
jgi:hypothetical protein